MAGELKQATAMRDAHAAQTEMLLVERNKLGDELMRVRTKAKLAGKAKAANPGLTPSPAPGSAYRSARKSEPAADEAKSAADDRDGNVVLSPFTPNPAAASPGRRRTVRRKSRLTHAPDHPATTPTPQTPPTDDVDSAYKPMGPGRDCTLGRGREGEGVEQTHCSIRVGRRKRTRRLVERVTRRITGECAEGDDARRDA